MMTTAKAAQRRKMRRFAWGRRAWGIAFPFIRKEPSCIEVDLVLLHQIVKRWSADPEQLGCFREVGSGLGESQLENFAFGAGARCANGERLRFFPGCCETEIGSQQ